MRNVAFKLTLAQGASGSIGGVYVPFFSAWLAARGFSVTEIGNVLAAGMLLRIVFVPLAGIVADARNDRRGAMLVLYGLMLAAYAALNWLESFAALATAVIVASIAGGSVSPLLESVSVRLADRFGFDYGRVRLWGSAMFVAGNVLSGIAVSLFGLWIVAPWLTVVLILNVASVYILPRPRGERPGRDLGFRLRATFAEARELLAMPVFLVFLAAAGLVQGSHSYLYNFAGLHWRELGYSGALIGLLVPIGILGEIALFAASVRVMRLVSPPLLLAMGAAGGMVRWTILAFDPPLAFLFLAQCLHGASFAMSHLGAMYFVLRAVPPRLAATGQSLYAVSSGGLFMGLGAYACGPLYAQFGGFTALLMTAMCAASGLFAFLLLRLWQGGRITAQSGGDEAHDNI